MATQKMAKRGNLTKNASQPHGGAKKLPEKAAHMAPARSIPSGGCGPGIFRTSSGGDTVGNGTKKGVYRMSGQAGAHMLGSCRKK